MTCNCEKKEDNQENCMCEEKHEYLDDLKRLQAEFENFIKRSEKEKKYYIEYGVCEFMGKLVDLFDDLDRAMKIVRETGSGEMVQGLEMVYNNFKEILEKEGVKEIVANGCLLDPNLHEVLEVIEGKENYIIEELQKGYMFKDRLLRTAKVRVGKGENNEL
ncbi:MAG: nucleotide exchange factor GrpE [DPANN group archaeon]|nr:nucleotide exchange factor GrpE [DPANN group archaeon]MBS3159425.1 nucleotide exchange factor GrpE [Candidatus Woesearchaeota archaeon]